MCQRLGGVDPVRGVLLARLVGDFYFHQAPKQRLAKPRIVSSTSIPP